MVGVTEQTFTGQGALGLSVQQFEEMEELTYDVAVALTLARDIKVESPVYGTQSPVYGTELRLSVGDCENVATASTGRVRPGMWGKRALGRGFCLADFGRREHFYQQGDLRCPSYGFRSICPAS
jgi:hypothetical protein